MAITNGYATREQLEVMLQGEEFTGTAHDTNTDRAIETASRSIDQFCVRRFYQDSTVQTRYYSPVDFRHLEVDDISVATGLLVTEDISLDDTFETSWTVDDYTSANGFRLMPENTGPPFNRLEALNSSWPRLRRSIKVIAKFGFATVPTEVEQACLLFAVRLYKRKDTPFGILSSPQGPSARLPQMDPDIANTIGHFRRFVRVDA